MTNAERILEFEYFVEHFQPQCTSDQYNKELCVAVLKMLKDYYSQNIIDVPCDKMSVVTKVIHCPNCKTRMDLRILYDGIINCKDCEHYDGSDISNHLSGLGICSLFGERMVPNGFCSEAEIRTSPEPEPFGYSATLDSIEVVDDPT